MAAIQDIDVDLKVIAGSAQLTMAAFLRLARGKIIPLDDARSRAFSVHSEDHLLTVEANGQPIADARLTLNGPALAARIVRARESETKS